MTWTDKAARSTAGAPWEGGLPVVDAAAAVDDGVRNLVLETVAERGAALVRGLALRGTADFATHARALLGEPVEEREAFAARTPLPGGAYSATHWPADQEMCVHHELSHTLRYPRLLAFGCTVPAAEGGATVLADGDLVLRNLPAELVERFERVGWILERRYAEGTGVPWEQAFGTDSAAEVEKYCRANAVQYRWGEGGDLRTRQRRPAVVRHPLTGARYWFNQAVFFSRWTLDPDIREYLLAVYGEDGLPFDTRWGDGEPITADVVEAVHAAHRSASTRHRWGTGDLIVIDNLRVGHGREPFTGRREVLAMMGSPVEFGEGLTRPEAAALLEPPAEWP